MSRAGRASATRTFAAAALVLAAAAAVGGMSFAAAFGRPEPGPCRDVVNLEASAAAICAAPEADPALVIGAGALGAALVTGTAVVVIRSRRTGRSPVR